MTTTLYKNIYRGISAFSEERVAIIGEVREDGKEYYLFDVIGFEPENGKSFKALKNNISLITVSYSVSDASELLGLSPKWIRTYARNNFEKQGKQWNFTLEQLKEMGKRA